MRIFTRHISLVAGGTQGKMFFPPPTLGNFNRKTHYSDQCRYVYVTCNFKAVKLHKYDQINASLRL